VQTGQRLANPLMPRNDTKLSPALQRHEQGDSTAAASSSRRSHVYDDDWLIMGCTSQGLPEVLSVGIGYLGWRRYDRQAVPDHDREAVLAESVPDVHADTPHRNLSPPRHPFPRTGAR
jgi:hypothetical protein